MTEQMERPLTQKEAGELIRQTFIEDYTNMRSWGMSHQKIADRLGVTRGSLLRRCERNKVYLPEDHEREVLWRLDRLIASGREFTSAEIFAADGSTIAGALARRERDGLITRLGWSGSHNEHGGRNRIWQSTAAQRAVAV